MKAVDIHGAMKSEPQYVSEDGGARFWVLDSFNDGMVWAGKYTGQSPWTRHPDGDKLLQVLDGEVEITVLTDEGPIHKIVGANCMFVVPRGFWHRHHARQEVTEFGAVPGRTEHSEAEDPRHAS